MRLFQNSGVYPSYRPKLKMLSRNAKTFDEHIEVFLSDRFGATHILKPVLENEPDAFFTNGDRPRVQRVWAAEQGMKAASSREDILLAQIEHHRTEVFYNMDPVRYPGAFAKRLPGSVRRTIFWRAAPTPDISFAGYDLAVCNFPSILETYKRQGLRTAYFAPAFDPAMESYGRRRERPIDVLFVGGYSRHHRVRAMSLEVVARLRDRFNIVMNLDASRMTRLAETPAGLFGPLQWLRRPKAVRAVNKGPVFGLGLYEQLSKAKVVFNGTVDMAQGERGNMRCWEAMGCGALLLSDNGVYPEGMVNQKTMLTYAKPEQLPEIIENAIRGDERQRLSAAGFDMVKDHYSKERQWQAFLSLC